MSRDASLSLDWADGTYTFRLGIGELRELQEKTDCGPLALFRRIEAGNWRVDDAATILRLGLIGGGMTPVEALRLTRVYVEARPLLENVLHAQAVLWCALAGSPDEDGAQKKSAAKRKASKTSRTASGGSAPSTASAGP